MLDGNQHRHGSWRTGPGRPQLLRDRLSLLAVRHIAGAWERKLKTTTRPSAEPGALIPFLDAILEMGEISDKDLESTAKHFCASCKSRYPRLMKGCSLEPARGLAGCWLLRRHAGFRD